MTGYVRRRFALGAEESMECEMRLEEHAGQTWVVLREPASLRRFGALTARFEHVANLITVELAMRGLQHRPVRFFHQCMGFDNGRVQSPARIQEVLLTKRDGQYCFARWLPLDAVTAAQLNAGADWRMAARTRL